MDIRRTKGNPEHPPAVKLHRPLRCPVGCCCFCNQSIEARDGATDDFIGHVIIPCYICWPSFKVYNKGTPVYDITSKRCCACACGNVGYEIKDAKTGQSLNRKIYKQWGGLVKETFTDADNFLVEFPRNTHTHTSTGSAAE